MDKPRAEDLRKELDQAQREYIKVRQEILNTNQVYRSLSADDRALAALSTFRDQALGPKTLLLVYHIGRERSHLMLLGGGATRAEAFSLAIPPEEAAELMAPPATGRWATLVALVNQALGGYSGDSLRRGFRKVPVPGQREGRCPYRHRGPTARCC